MPIDEKPFAFVLMPFDQSFSDIYKLGIQAAARDAGVIAERVDEQLYSESILERIYRQIRNADFVIADMTGRNANVFYEVGYAHALKKPCTLLTQRSDDIPFDLKHHRHIVYEGSIQSLKDKLSIELEWHKAEIEKSRAETISVDLKDIGGTLEKNDWSTRADLTLVFDLHNRSQARSPDIEAIYIYTTHDWFLKQGGESCPSTTTDDSPTMVKTFVKSPVARLSPGGWAQIKLEGARKIWTKWSGEERKDTYRVSGALMMDIQTSEGVLRRKVDAATDFDDIPF